MIDFESSFLVHIYFLNKIMASRRITSTCLSRSNQNVFRQSPRSRSIFPSLRVNNVRQLQTTSILREEKANVGKKRDPAPKIVRGRSKLFKDADEAVADIQSGSTILSAGFGLCGTAGNSELQ
jgi:3-oxoacid CoA-transferase